MRSQVTRHVLRRLPAGRAPGTLPLYTSLPRPTFRTYPVGCRVPRTAQRRTFLKLFQKPPRTLKELGTEPGYETLLQHRAAENDNLRPPPEPELAKAWRDFFGHKTRYGRAVNSTQAMCAHGVLRHLCQQERPAKDAHLTVQDLRTAMQCLSKPPRDDATHHLELSRMLYKEIRRRVLGVRPGPAHDTELESRMKPIDTFDYEHDLRSLLVALSQYGKALKARDLLVKYYERLNGVDQYRARRNWMPVLRGLAKEGRGQALKDLVFLAETYRIRYNPEFQAVLTGFFAHTDNASETKSWFHYPMKGGDKGDVAPGTYYDVLQFALRNNEQEWAMAIYQSLIKKLESGSPQEAKLSWDTAFQWAVLLLGKGIDHVEHMIRVAQKIPGKSQYQPDIETINGLLKAATDKDDPYLAERVVSLSKDLRLEPDFQTYTLQLDYRIRAKDLAGAFRAYQALQSLEEPSGDMEMPVLNKFIRALCSEAKPEYEQVLEVTSYLEQRHITLEPETVVSICMAFLKNDETYEVIDTLSLHTVHYSITERHLVRKAFVDYCLDKTVSTARVWDAYALLRQFFPEVENEDRVSIMDAFFDRGRADMACHVFGHMRSHGNPMHRPTLEVYVRCFEGIGRCPDLESLKMVHNMLKMDTTIQPNTLLYNSLMIAYIACDTSHQALDFWNEITNSPEGPSYSTLELVFRAYEVAPYGDEPSRELWEKIKRMEIDVPIQVYSAYMTALAAHGQLAEVKVLMEGAEDVTGKRPNVHTLAYTYNALPSPELKDEFEAWAEFEYPPTWEALKKKYKRRADAEGLRTFRLPRPWKA
ncbi:Uu.00g096820.m01.CDS01 [Anthostomella pinea]|uniref:Uu.00g096820.m01.CDS01 n=1 Tax=Anthostomella pinea TaxID=933095 RepID=A0AAI8VCD1_9PEZI|nr:Uu.00g096820.m01.CDS01 [Anthostomella pinea]